MEQQTLLVISLFLYSISTRKVSSVPAETSMNKVHCQHGQRLSDASRRVMVRRGK